jgi:hypothetical protein
MSLLADTHWGATFHLNVARAVSATLTLMILYPIGRLTGFVSPETSFLSVFVIPLGLLLFGLAGILTFRLAGSLGVPFMQQCEGLLSLIMILFIAIGDPLIWVVRKYYPNLIPVNEFSIVNPRAVILVQKDRSVQE